MSSHPLVTGTWELHLVILSQFFSHTAHQCSDFFHTPKSVLGKVVWCTLSVCFESQATVAWSFLLMAVSERLTQRASGMKHFHPCSSATITIKLYKQNLLNCLQFWFIQSKNLSDQMHCSPTPLGYHTPVMYALKIKQFISLKKGAKTFSGTNVRCNPPIVYSRILETGTIFASTLILCCHTCTVCWSSMQFLYHFGGAFYAVT